MDERERIEALLKEIFPEIDFNSSNRLVDDGILDFVSIITLVSELSMEFNIKFDTDEIIPENFNSLDAIVDTVKRLKK